MIKTEKILQLISHLDDSAARENASESLLALSAVDSQVVDLLYIEQFKAEGEMHIEIYSLLAALGDRDYVKRGTGAVNKKIVKAMISGAKKSRSWISDEAHQLAIECLVHWGIEVPPILDQRIRICHVCEKNSTQERIKKCFLIDCDKEVCREHASILKNPTGTENWFCSKAHYDKAQKNPTYMM